MVCPQIGRECIFRDDVWTSTWIRRGDTNAFDCEMIHGPTKEVATYVAVIKVKNDEVLIHRNEYRSTRSGVDPPEGKCEWKGFLSEDGNEVGWSEKGSSRVVR